MAVVKCAHDASKVLEALRSGLSQKGQIFITLNERDASNESKPEKKKAVRILKTDLNGVTVIART